MERIYTAKDVEEWKVWASRIKQDIENSKDSTNNSNYNTETYKKQAKQLNTKAMIKKTVKPVIGKNKEYVTGTRIVYSVFGIPVYIKELTLLTPGEVKNEYVIYNF